MRPRALWVIIALRVLHLQGWIVIPYLYRWVLLPFQSILRGRSWLRSLTIGLNVAVQAVLGEDRTERLREDVGPVGHRQGQGSDAEDGNEHGDSLDEGKGRGPLTGAEDGGKSPVRPGNPSPASGHVKLRLSCL